jgi:hypothetical protein
VDSWTRNFNPYLAALTRADIPHGIQRVRLPRTEDNHAASAARRDGHVKSGRLVSPFDATVQVARLLMCAERTRRGRKAKRAGSLVVGFIAYVLFPCERRLKMRRTIQHTSERWSWDQKLFIASIKPLSDEDRTKDWETVHVVVVEVERTVELGPGPAGELYATSGEGLRRHVRSIKVATEQSQSDVTTSFTVFAHPSVTIISVSSAADESVPLLERWRASKTLGAAYPGRPQVA